MIKRKVYKRRKWPISHRCDDSACCCTWSFENLVESNNLGSVQESFRHLIGAAALCVLLYNDAVTPRPRSLRGHGIQYCSKSPQPLQFFCCHRLSRAGQRSVAGEVGGQILRLGSVRSCGEHMLFVSAERVEVMLKFRLAGWSNPIVGPFVTTYGSLTVSKQKERMFQHPRAGTMHEHGSIPIRRHD